MYYKIDNKVYNKDEIEGKTFDETNKPEPLFTLEEVTDILAVQDLGFRLGKKFDKVNYFKQVFKITI